MADQIKTEVEKLDPASRDISADKRAELLRLFPEARTEGGRVDFDQLKRALGEAADPGKERYGLVWPGKAECFRTIQAPSLATLRPALEQSVNFNATENLIIEGDNLEVLKLLQKSYLNKIKMIYIDPPYNTGNDFIYPDNYAESLQTYLQYTGQVDAEGRKFGTNTEADGRFHSKWLNMMYPRLYLAKNLLRDDGVIFISVDDNEITNLRAIMNEIFGEDQFVSVVVVQANKRGQTYKEIAKTHEYIVAFSKTDEFELFELEKGGDALPYKDSHGAFDLWELRNRNPKFGRHNRPNLYFPIYVSSAEQDENGYSKVRLEGGQGYDVEVLPQNSDGGDSCWRWGKDKIAKSDLTSNTAVIVARQKRDGGWNIYEKSRKATTKAKSLWTETDVISEQGTVELGALGLADYFEHPKPLGLIQKCVKIGASTGDLILDFFAGSGTCGHAVLAQNQLDGAARKFILVQLPEPTERKDFETIAAVTEERIRRVINKLKKENGEKLNLGGPGEQDLGFRCFKLADSNFKAWDSEAPKNEATLGEQLSLHIQHVQKGRSGADILYEILLKSGFPLTVPVERLLLAGKEVFAVADGAMLICLEHELTLDVIRAMAERKPERVVCLDEGFAGNDQLKTNAVQTFKSKSVVFRTV